MMALPMMDVGAIYRELLADARREAERVVDEKIVIKCEPFDIRCNLERVADGYRVVARFITGSGRDCKFRKFASAPMRGLVLHSDHVTAQTISTSLKDIGEQIAIAFFKVEECE
jgi:hypothetical protein